MHELREGQKLSAVWWGGGEAGYSVGRSGVKSIEVVMIRGQMNMVPWAMVTMDDGPPWMVNIANVEEVRLADDESKAGRS